MEFIEWKEIEHNGRKRSTCPKCSTSRKNKSDKCLSINHDKGTAFCHHCEAVSFKEDVAIETEKEYKLPIQTWKNYTAISDKLVKYLEDRKISQRTAIALGWTEEKYYQPALKKEVNNLVFNFFEGETLVNKKYRSANKKFIQSSGTKSIFYNINSVIGKKKVYIVEGEFDVAALYEFGIKDGIVSVPNGANDNDDFWINSEKYIKDVKEFVIAVDNDEKGNSLKDKISQRLGKHRCSYLEFKNKDANGDLVSMDLKETIRGAKRFPVSGTFNVSDLFDGIIDLYDNGLPKTIYPKSKYWRGIKDVFSVMRGQLTVGTGIPSHGKSNVTDWYVLNLINDYKLKGSWFSPEHSPMSLYHTNLASKVVGKNFWGKMNGYEYPRITKQELEKYRDWADEKVYLTDCDAGQLPTWDWLLQKFEEQLYSFGIDIFVVDAFNKVLLPKGNKLEEINIVLTKLTHFAQSNNVMVFLIAHPTKMKKSEETGLYEEPTLYDVSGSADFRNQTHNGFTIYRCWDDAEKGTEACTKFINQKTKYTFQGEIGSEVILKYCEENGRFHTGNEQPLLPLWEDEYEKELPKINTNDAFGVEYNINNELEF